MNRFDAPSPDGTPQAPGRRSRGRALADRDVRRRDEGLRARENHDWSSGTASLVRSRDGTEIAYWTTGTGPPLVVVHGTPADHTRWRPLLPYLEPHFTVHAIDRRGRGASGDAPDYALEREYEDVAAVVDAVAADSNGPVKVYGHSHGGIVAFGAATLTANVHKLVLYEGWPVPEPEVYALPAGLDARMDARLAAGDRDGVVELLFRELENMSDADMATFKSAPSWSGRVAAAHTITREIRSERSARLDLELARRITVPVLVASASTASMPASLTPRRWRPRFPKPASSSSMANTTWPTHSTLRPLRLKSCRS